MSDKLISTELPVQKNPNESSLEDGWHKVATSDAIKNGDCLLYTSPSPRDDELSRMPSSA